MSKVRARNKASVCRTDFCNLLILQDPQLSINKWLQSQTRDIKTMTDVTGNPEEERRVDYYYQPWVTEGVCRLSPQQNISTSHCAVCFFLQILLRENPAKESRVGLQLGCAQLLGQQQSIVSRVDVTMIVRVLTPVKEPFLVIFLML